MAVRRNLKKLELAALQAKTKKQKALAYFNLGLFHDNNGREAVAIPNYKKALSLGLDNKIKAECLAWLASSLYKTGRPKEALKQVKRAMSTTTSKQLLGFLVGLEERITTRLAFGEQLA